MWRGIDVQAALDEREAVGGRKVRAVRPAVACRYFCGGEKRRVEFEVCDPRSSRARCRTSLRRHMRWRETILPFLRFRDGSGLLFMVVVVYLAFLVCFTLCFHHRVALVSRVSRFVAWDGRRVTALRLSDRTASHPLFMCIVTYTGSKTDASTIPARKP